MSVQASSWVISNSKHKGAGLLCLMMIANHAHSDGTNAFPSILTLAKECRMSERQIQRIIQVLECSGELLVERSAGRKSHTFAVVMGPPVPKKSADNKPADTDLPNSNGDNMSETNGDNMSETNGDNMSETNGDNMSGQNADPNPNGDILDIPTVTYSMFNGDISGTPSPYMNRPEPSFEPEESARTAPAPFGAPASQVVNLDHSLFAVSGEMGTLGEDAPPSETVASACNSFGDKPDTDGSDPKGGGAGKAPRGSLEPGAYTSQAMIDFDRMFVRQRRLDEKSLRHPIRDVKLEAQAQRCYDAVGPAQYKRALDNFFSCFDGTDPYVASRGFDLGLFVRQFEKWEGGKARPAYNPGSQRLGRDRPNRDGPRRDVVPGSSEYLSAAQILEQQAANHQE